MTSCLRICTAILTLSAGAHAQQPTAPAKTPAKTTTQPAKAPAKTAAKTPAKAPAKAAAAAALTTEKDKFSYALGMNISLGLKAQGVDIDPEIVARGFRDQHTGGATQMSAQEMGDVLTRAQQQLQARQAEQQKITGDKNRREGAAFLEKNKARAGVVTLPSGLQYEVMTPGTGPVPKSSDTVTTHYRGTLLDGTEFDSSYKRNEPASFPVTGVIRGWTEALQLMKVGSKWRLYIPSELAYGERQRGQHITPNSVLIFDIELLAIKDSAASPK